MPNALDNSLLGRLTDVVDRVTAAVLEETPKTFHVATRGWDVAQRKWAGDIGIARSVMEAPCMLDLLDLPTTFPLLWDIMGWNIQLYISPLSVKFPEPRPTDDELPPASGYHQDSGRPKLEMQWDHALAGDFESEQEMVEQMGVGAGRMDDRAGGTTPMIALKIAYFLTDTTIPNCGAMRVIPRTHRSDRPPPGPAGHAEAEGSVELAVPAGTAVLFDRRLWHSASRNFSDITRKVIFFGYSYRWLRGQDYSLAPSWLLKQCDPIQRQLLGDSANIKGFWQPTEEDVPLKGFIERWCGAGNHAVKSKLIFPSTGKQGDIEGHYIPILGEWGKGMDPLEDSTVARL